MKVYLKSELMHLIDRSESPVNLYTVDVTFNEGGIDYYRLANVPARVRISSTVAEHVARNWCLMKVKESKASVEDYFKVVRTIKLQCLLDSACKETLTLAYCTPMALNFTKVLRGTVSIQQNGLSVAAIVHVDIDTIIIKAGNETVFNNVRAITHDGLEVDVRGDEVLEVRFI